MTYYLILTDYVGPNRNEHLDDGRFRVQTVPGLTNLSQEERIDGFLGQNGDYSEYAHGSFGSIAAARKHASKLAGGLREVEDEREELMELNASIGEWNRKTGDHTEPVKAIWAVGEFREMGPEETRDWLYDSANLFVREPHTPAQIEAWIDRSDDDARSEINATIDFEAARELVREQSDEYQRKNNSLLGFGIIPKPGTTSSSKKQK